MKEKTLNNILFISLVITSLAALLVAVVVFFKAGLWEPTIAAGFIGFTGAIIGGFITWLGVKVTIENSNRIRELDAIPSKIEKINKFHTSINGLLKIMFVNSNGASRAFLSANNVLKYIEEHALITETITINETVYTEFIGLVSYAQVVMYENTGSKDSYDTYSNFQERLKSMIDDLNKTLEREAITFTQFYFNFKK
ncbi:hypothetical protein QH639_25185 [Lysinibacillus sp. 1 U-2021]|uniref:hypothetical protein n=1 Tax=Lysinibacillus sp. 1 U-2021 TaxID=3039426 RepID=UPI00247FF035|nr:hypothetical protein [Lysinibacillus sp. 1 U-2021]WGT39034.1 hypothetical protein QH639_25185 [Lysinibacillus sp. 1 U-2021]